MIEDVSMVRRSEESTVTKGRSAGKLRNVWLFCWKELTSRLVPLNPGRKVLSISSMAAGWKNLLDISAM